MVILPQLSKASFRISPKTLKKLAGRLRFPPEFRVGRDAAVWRGPCSMTDLFLPKISFRLQILNLSNRADTFRIHVQHFDSLILSPLCRLSISSRTPNRDHRSATSDRRLEAFHQSPKTSILGQILLDWAPSLLAIVAFGPCHR